MGCEQTPYNIFERKDSPVVRETFTFRAFSTLSSKATYKSDFSQQKEKQHNIAVGTVMIEEPIINNPKVNPFPVDNKDS